MPSIIENGAIKRVSVAEYNEYVASLRANIKLNPDGTQKSDKVEDLDKIWVNGQEFTGMAYQGLLTINTKTYVEEPTRANDGSIPNINDYNTFIVPRCKVNFKYFDIYDYRRLCDAIQSNEFTVKYYDKQFNEFVVHKMYCEPEEMFKLYNVGIDVFGVLDYEISFIGTLNDLQEHQVTYNANGGTILGNPSEYVSIQTYKKGDRVTLGSGDSTRYFEAIWFENSFYGKALTETQYWLKHNFYEYTAIAYTKGDIVYEQLKEGRKYYIATQNVPADRPLTDTEYWQTITVKTFDEERKYTSNRISREDKSQGQFVANSRGNEVYEAIYYFDEFDGKDPTNTVYWKLLALGNGVNVKWGNSIVVADPEDLFNAPSGKASTKWNTRADGSGFTYYPSQSLNVFKNLTLYAIWE